MSAKRTVYSAKFKTKVVLEVIKNDKTLAEIALENNVTPKNIQNWKKIFLENASTAMEPEKAVKAYKAETVKLQKTIDDYAKTVGQLTLEKGWLEGKLKSLDLPTKKSMVESELKNISLVKQCEMLGLCRSNHYYVPAINEKIVAIKEHIRLNQS